MPWTTEKFTRYVNEGRGQGSGKNYKPWICVQDFSPDDDTVHRILGWKTEREHHLLTNDQKKLFYLLEWSNRVVDIQEQFPLIDLDLCTKIAEDMGVDYPTDPESGAPCILTTVFMLVSTCEGKSVYEARTFKPSRSLKGTRTVIELEIEKRYYAAKGVNWKLFERKNISKFKSMVAKIEWVHSAYKLQGNQEMNEEDLLNLSTELKLRLQKSSSTVHEVANRLDVEMHIEPGTSLYLFRYLIANKLILVDISIQKSLSFLPTKEIKFNNHAL